MWLDAGVHDIINELFVQLTGSTSSAGSVQFSSVQLVWCERRFDLSTSRDADDVGFQFPGMQTRPRPVDYTRSWLQTRRRLGIRTVADRLHVATSRIIAGNRTIGRRVKTTAGVDAKPVGEYLSLGTQNEQPENIQGGPKNGATDSWPYFYQVLTDLENFFTGCWILKIQPHLAYVAILPRETLMSAKEAINDELQGSVLCSYIFKVWCGC